MHDYTKQIHEYKAIDCNNLAYTGLGNMSATNRGPIYEFFMIETIYLFL